MLRMLSFALWQHPAALIITYVALCQHNICCSFLLIHQQ